MSINFGLFLLFSVLVTGLIINPVYAQEPPVNGTETMAESNSTSTGDEALESEAELETELETEDEMADTEDEILTFGDGIADSEITPTVPSPLKQIKDGIMPESVICKEGLGLVFKLNGQPACVKTTSIEKLTAWGWIR